MTVTTVRMASLSFTKGAGIRFPLSALTRIVTFPPLVIQNVHLPDNHLLMPVFDVDLPVSSLGDHPETLNYAVIENVGYWANLYSVVANAHGVVTFRLERDAASAVYGSEAKGMFSALPTVTRPVQRANQAATLYTKRKIELPKIPRRWDGQKMYWLQITTNRTMKHNREDNTIYRYGCFVCAVGDTYYNLDPTHASSDKYLALKYIINSLTTNVDNTYFTEANILDISISERCPYPYVVDTQEVQPGQTGGYYYTLTAGGTRKAPTQFSRSFSMYDVTTVGYNESDLAVDTVTLSLSDVEKVFGAVTIQDSTNNTVGSLGNDRNWTLKCRCVSDIGNLYTVLYTEDESIKFVLQEGHIPFAGDSWRQYQALNMNYDREMMSINQHRADAEAANNVGSGLASGILAGIVTGGNPYAAVATSAVSLVSTFIGRSITVKAEKDQQSVTEDMQRIQPSTAYNVGYGLSYILDSSIFGGAYIAVMMPSEVDEGYLANHVKMNGYPAVGMRSITFGTGFYRGYIMSFEAGPGTHPLTNKLVFDLMNAELADGIRFVTSREDI